MPAYIVFIREYALDHSPLNTYWSKSPPTLNSRPINMLASNGSHLTLERPEVKCMVVAWHKDERALCESPAQQEAAQHQFDSWLADMEYCDRF